MTSIFLDLLQDCMEVFMDDFMVYATSFDACLENLSRMLTRCINTNLVLNFEKNGIVLGHLISNRRIEVDKSKIDIITSLPNPTSVREVCSFLGHVGFYRRFIMNFNKIALPLSKLLQKDVDFNFDQPYAEAFQELKISHTRTDSPSTQLGVSIRVNPCDDESSMGESSRGGLARIEGTWIGVATSACRYTGNR
ncbi:Retrovirus-related Pol polyprotein from transposon 17.6, partial [Mucuna pruriens]